MSLQSVYMYGYARLTVIGVCADIHKCFYTQICAVSSMLNRRRQAQGLQHCWLSAIIAHAVVPAQRRC